MEHLSQPPQRLRNQHGKRQGRRKSKGWEGKEGMEKYKSKRQGGMRDSCEMLSSGQDVAPALRNLGQVQVSVGERASNAIQHPSRQQSLDSVGDTAKQRQKQNRGNERQGGTYWRCLQVMKGKRVTRMHVYV